MTLQAETAEGRAQVLVRHGFNLDLVPSRLVLDDYQTDSLMHRAYPSFPARQDADRELDEQLSNAFAGLFNLPQVIAVAQGRLAEALLVNALVSPGDCVLGSAPFPTLEAHVRLKGASLCSVPTVDGDGVFAADLDSAALECAIRRVGRQRVPFIVLEPCTNAIGGAPMSVENLRAIKAVASRHGIALILDATRIISNACLVREHASGWQGSDELHIVKAMCELADGVLMSATKEMPTTIGGFLALRERALFERCLDQALIFGSGLDLMGKRRLLAALHEPSGLVERVRARIDQVRRLYGLVGAGRGLSAGAHGLFLHGSAAFAGMAAHLCPARAFLNHLYVSHGVRGALNPGASSEQGDAQVRFAIAVPGKSQRALEAAAAAIRAALAETDQFVGLEEVYRPKGMAGGLLATYRQAGGMHA